LNCAKTLHPTFFVLMAVEANTEIRALRAARDWPLFYYSFPGFVVYCPYFHKIN